MTKIDQLFIRACKSKDPYKRLKSVRRRFYIRLNNDDKFILIKLAEICDIYLPVKGTKIIEELLHPFVMRDVSMELKLLRIFLNQIRFAEVNYFPGLTPPAMFRKNLKIGN
jgi:hypothetical protein